MGGPHRTVSDGVVLTAPDGGAVGRDPATSEALAQAFAQEWARVVATMIRVTGDWDVAEEATAAAFERAAATWPRDGVPRTPGAWLTTAARNQALDRLRRRGVEAGKLQELAVMQERGGNRPVDPGDAALADPEWDDRLRLLFTCAHPALPLESRVALTLRTVGGLTTSEIAHAFLVSEAAMSQRIVRAKAKIAHAGIPYRVPPPEALPERLEGVLAVLYLVYNEGYAASAGESLQRLDLAAEAIRLTRLVVELLPDAEAVSLLALMLLQHSRSATRVDDFGELVPLEEQDRRRWDASEIAEGLALLASLDGDWGPYRVQAEIQAVHVRARVTSDTDWGRILALYDLLPDTPIVALNRAIALAMAVNVDAGLAALAGLADDPRLAGNHLVPAAVADLNRRRGRLDEAADAYREAITLAPQGPQRRFLERRLASLA